MGPDRGDLVAAILNAGWMVRHYSRGRSGLGKLRRDQAIIAMGEAVRHAFSSSTDYESLLAAVADALRPKDEAPF